jgi:GNAT superfamily N-acetyltransferase
MRAAHRPYFDYSLDRATFAGHVDAPAAGPPTKETSMSGIEYEITLAGPADTEELRAMQARSMRLLGGRYYPERTIESFLRAPGTLDDAVVAEGHYFVARDRQDRIVGSGGWSQNQPGYAKGGAALPMSQDRAIVRSVFVDPDCARQGIGGALMRHVEGDCGRAGIALLTLSATLSGVPLYGVLGYVVLRPRVLLLGDGARLNTVDMKKDLSLRQAA